MAHKERKELQVKESPSDRRLSPAITQADERNPHRGRTAQQMLNDIEEHLGPWNDVFS